MMLPTLFFRASKEKREELQKWLPRTTTFPKASVIINENTVQALRDNNTTNIMASEVEKVEGFFEADDLVKILTQNYVNEVDKSINKR
ncbi:MAG: hypothetical protein HC831_17340 [Chloroflexia bacterium]|nr:hypothetical protein [Chloroflexia bacterium]